MMSRVSYWFRSWRALISDLLKNRTVIKLTPQSPIFTMQWRYIFSCDIKVFEINRNKKNQFRTRRKKVIVTINFQCVMIPLYFFSLHMHAKPSFAHRLQTAKMASSRTSTQNNGPRAQKNGPWV